MDILGLKTGHDGHIAHLNDGILRFSIEEEKDSGPRYGELSPAVYFKALGYLDRFPDVVAIGGWTARPGHIDSGYWGIEKEKFIIESKNILGKSIDFFSTTHERSHILCSYGLSPFPQGQPCYVLIWEGNFGSFYKIDETMNIQRIGDPLLFPGTRYLMLYALADPTFPDLPGHYRLEDAGKLMALASYGAPGAPDKDEAEVIDYLFSGKRVEPAKPRLYDSKFYNIGVESDEFKQLARRFSDELFKRFFEFAKNHMREKLPLVIGGGCGLSCDWNSQWKMSGLFSDVFVPPCTNDSGVAIGTALDAQLHFSGQAKIEWNVYAGEEFVVDTNDLQGYSARALDLREISEFLLNGNIIAWVQGRYEIGPRALGNRSIIAMPFSPKIHSRLNAIKQREGFRPIAPLCLEEDIDLHFDNHGPSPHMLYFQTVKTSRLPAITHVDGSARLQSVNAHQNPEMHALLTAFKQVSGFGVLCNTSLNFKGTGFINRMSELIRYCRDRELDGFVVGNKFYRKRV